VKNKISADEGGRFVIWSRIAATRTAILSSKRDRKIRDQDGNFSRSDRLTRAELFWRRIPSFPSPSLRPEAASCRDALLQSGAVMAGGGDSRAGYLQKSFRNSQPGFELATPVEVTPGFVSPVLVFFRC
jgi:hypothetical protein